MMKIRIEIVVVLIIGLLFHSCKKEETPQESQLEKIGLVGKWEISGYEYNGISDMIPHCCEFLELEEDNILTDYQGNYKINGLSYSKFGTFQVNLDSAMLIFNDSLKQRKINYQLSKEYLDLIYTDDSVIVVQTWKKVE